MTFSSRNHVARVRETKHVKENTLEPQPLQVNKEGIRKQEITERHSREYEGVAASLFARAWQLAPLREWTHTRATYLPNPS